MNIEKNILSLLDHYLKINTESIKIKPVVSLEGHELSVHLSVGFPGAFFPKTLLQEFTSSIQKAFPQYQTQVFVNHFIKAHRTQLPGQGLRNVKNTIAIASGKGGVGKSTVAVNLAVALAQGGAKVGILDADIYGPSIPLMLGKTDAVEIFEDRYLPVYAHGVQAMSIGYLTQGDPALIWRGPMLAKSLIQMINITLWDELDYLFIDLPPGTGDIQLSLVQKIPLTAAIIVTTPQTVATLDAQKALKMFAKTNIDVLGIIENMSTYHCSHCGHEASIFGQGGAAKLCQTMQCTLLGQLPLHSQIGIECDTGMPTAAQKNSHLAAAFTEVARQVSLELAKRPLNYADKFPPIVVEN